MEMNIPLMFMLALSLIGALIVALVVAIDRRKINKRIAEHQKQWNKIKSESPPELWDELYDQYLVELYFQYPMGEIGIPRY